MREDANAAVQRAIEQLVEQGTEIGLQVCAYLGGKLVVDCWTGLADEASGRKVDGDTLFTVFSATKGIAATALHIQAERGRIAYDDPIVRHWPEFGAHGKERATVLDALTHRTGVPQMPDGCTPEMMCDWEAMVAAIAAQEPLWEPGTRSGYHAYTYGWIVGELVRRTDKYRRAFGVFVQDEICAPLGIDSLWMGIPDEAEPRVATLKNMPPPPADAPVSALMPRAIPPNLGVTQEVFGRPDVRRAAIPGAGGITNARSLARHYAMFAGRGELDGVRLLSADRVDQVRSLQTDEVDAVIGLAVRKGMGYFLSGGSYPSVAPMGAREGAFGHPGAGGSIGWADPEAGLAVAICKNRMRAAASQPEHSLLPVAQALRAALRLPGYA
jgi:CubicO group peptidase (beta-lactamase class C family)